MRAVDERRADPVNGDVQPHHDDGKEGRQKGHDSARKEVGFRKFVVDGSKLLFLIVFAVIGANDAQSGEIFAGDAVKVVGQALHFAELVVNKQ